MAIWHKEKNQFKTGVQWLVWPVAAGFVGVSCGLTYFLVMNQPPDPVAVRLLTVKLGNVETTVTESGTVELREQRVLKSPTEGAVDRVLVKPGENVRAGQVLLTLRYPERKIALAKQQLKIEQEKLKLTRAQQKILESQEKLIAEERELQKLTPLMKEGAIARQLFQQQEDQVREARANLRDAQQETGETTFELHSLKLDRQVIQQQLQDTTVTSPLNGIVLGVNVKDGEGVELRTNLLTLGDPKQVRVKLQLSTLNASQVRVNQVTRVSAIGPNPQLFTGYVESLYPQALTPEETQKQEGGSQNQSTQATVPAIVRLDTPTRTLIPGSRVNVEIVLEQRQNVVVLETEAIQRSSTHPFVWVQDSQNKAQKRNINLGLEGLVTTEVTSGLGTGEQVIVPPAELQLKPGTPVKS